MNTQQKTAREKLKTYNQLYERTEKLEKTINDMQRAQESLSALVMSLQLHDDKDAMTAFKGFHESHIKARRVLLKMHDKALTEMKNLCK
jgi:hypothetical protein